MTDRTVDPQLFLANPWQRLFASVIDTVAIVAIMTATVFLSSVFGRHADAVRQSLPIAAPIVVWFSILAFWTNGATPGMLAMRIRIVDSATGAKPGFSHGLMRVLGFMVACLPMKLGLLPIITHPLRQGWHDQLGGTLVVRTTYLSTDIGWQKPVQPPKKNPGDGWPAPNIKLALAGLPLAIPTALVSTIVVTWPVAKYFNIRLAGVDGDSSVFVWSAWFLGFSLKHHQGLLSTNLLFYPLNVSLLYNTMDWLGSFLIQPVLQHWGMIVAYNTEWFGSLVFCQLGAYLLAAGLLRSRVAGLVAAPIYGLSPYFMAHGLGHLNLISGGFLPLFLLFVYAALVKRSPYYGVLAGLFLGLGGLCDFEYLIMGAIAGVILLAAFYWQSDLSDRHGLIKVGVSAVLCALVALCIDGGLLLPTLALNGQSSFMFKPIAYYATPENYFLPTPMQWFARPHNLKAGDIPVENVESVVYLGLIALCLFGMTARDSIKRYRVWALIAWSAFILSFGVIVTTSISKYLLFWPLSLAAFPGTLTLLPWDFSELSSSCVQFARGSFDFDFWNGSFGTPMLWLPDFIRPLSTFRATDRLVMLVLCGLVVLAGYGVVAIRERLAKRFPRWAQVAACLSITLLIWVEYGAWPYPTYEPHQDRIVGQIHALARNKVAAVVNVPLGPSPDTMIEQTITEQPQFTGIISRTPIQSYQEIQGNRLLEWSYYLGDHNLSVFVSPTSLTKPELVRGAEQMESQGARFILVHKEPLTASTQAQVDKICRNWLGAKLIADDSYCTLYELPSRP